MKPLPLLLAQVVVVACAACISGGALTEKATPPDVRYFSVLGLDQADAGAQQAGRDVAAPHTKLRLGRFSSSANLRTRIVHRESDVEVETYDLLRWTENPEDYVRRAISHTLFEDGLPFDQVLTGSGPMLDVEVVSFEEVHEQGHRGGRVALAYRLYDENEVLARGLVSVSRAASDDRIESVVLAIGAAMNAAVSQIADAVVAHTR